MAFVRSIELDARVDIDIMQRSGEFIVRIPVGYDDATDVTFSIMVSLSPLPGYEPGCHELVFTVIESDGSDGQISARYDGLETIKSIPNKDDRRLILATITSAVSALIDLVNPHIVEMVTFTADLPKKALRKYAQIASVFAARGYKAGKADSWHGRHIWMMERPN